MAVAGWPQGLVDGGAVHHYAFCGGQGLGYGRGGLVGILPVQTLDLLLP